MSDVIASYVILDADAGERFATADFSDRADAEWRREQLVVPEYGKEFALVVWGVDASGAFCDPDTGERCVP